MLSVLYLHLTVDHPRVLALAVDVVDLREVVLLPQVGVEDVVQVDGEDAEEAAGAGRVDSVASMIGARPSIGPLSQASVG